MTDVIKNMDDVPSRVTYTNRRPSNICKMLEQLSPFQRCVVEMRRIASNKIGKLDSSVKKELLNDSLLRYFNTEDREDLFEGFLRMIVEFGEGGRIHELHLAPTTCNAFYNFLTSLSDAEQQSILNSYPFEADEHLHTSAIAVSTTFKMKFCEQISYIFSLKEERKKELVCGCIWKFINMADWPKVVAWIDHYDYRRHFPFEKIATQIFLDNNFTLLKTFIGANDTARQRRFVEYLDRLIGVKLGYEAVGALSEEEQRILDDGKRLEKNVPKFIKEFGVPERIAPNAMTARCRECLLYHHHRWVKNETTLLAFEETALEAMKSNLYVRNFYINYLCVNDFMKIALFFAVALNLNPVQYPSKLAMYCEENPDNVAEARMKVSRTSQKEADVTTVGDGEWCLLLDDSVPIIVVDDWAGVERVMTEIRDELLIGFDAEWKPNFLTMAEQIALLQIAVSHSVFLVDVVVLETRLTQPQWVEFFEALFCSKRNRKIGYDYLNDFRVLKNSFPFIVDLMPKFSNVICLYRLLSNVVQKPEACKAVFGGEVSAYLQFLFQNFHTLAPTYESGMNLCEMAKTLIGYTLDKTEQVGNWMRRPLRQEHCGHPPFMVQILRGLQANFGAIFSLDDKELLKGLQQISVVGFSKKESECAESITKQRESP